MQALKYLDRDPCGTWYILYPHGCFAYARLGALGLIVVVADLAYWVLSFPLQRCVQATGMGDRGFKVAGIREFKLSD